MNDILEYNGYYAKIQFSPEDQVFFGKLIGINDLVTFEGDTVKGLQKAFRESVDDYIETCKECNKNPEKVYKGVFNVRIPADLHRQAALAAAINNVTLNDFVRHALDQAVSTEHNPPVVKPVKH